MSDPYDIIVPMEKWYKYSYVCSICDALIEITNKTNTYKPQICCGENAIWLSVVDATIVPTQQKEEQTMETTTETLPQVMKLDWVENDVVTTKEYTEADVRHMVWQNKNLTQKQNEWYRKESQLRTLIEEVFADSSDQEALEQIADIFDVSLTKEIEVTAYIRVDATIEVDIREGDYDLEDLIRNNLTIDSFGSEISVNDYDVERVEEGRY
jgi:hypothetical protein